MMDKTLKILLILFVFSLLFNIMALLIKRSYDRKYNDLAIEVNMLNDHIRRLNKKWIFFLDDEHIHSNPPKDTK